MRRLWLAIVCFFRIVFGEPLPATVLPRLKAPSPPPPLPAPPVAPAPPPVVAAPPAPAKPSPEETRALQESGARAVLTLLQREGRLLDFLMEKIDAYSDEQVGAAVRAIHTGCRKAISEHAPLEPVLPGKEEEKVTVPSGFDASAIRLVGNVAGQPPFHGTLRHHGWKVPALKLPATDGKSAVVAPAEVEL